MARDLSDPRFQSERTDDQLLAALDHGKARNMPAFEDRLSSQEKLALVRYVRELGKDAKPTSALSQSASERAHQPSNDQRTQ